MRLQRVATRKYKEKTYYKWQVALPQHVVEEVGWHEGDLLDVQVSGESVVIRLNPGLSH